MAGSFGRWFGGKLRELFWPFLSDANAEQTQRRVGQKKVQAIIKTMPPDPCPKIGRYLCRMSDHLASRFRKRKHRKQFSVQAVLSDKVVNAMALPGGHILVIRSLLEFCEWNQDRVAFVLAHEMAHVVRGHVREREKQRHGVRLLTRFASVGWKLRPVLQPLAERLMMASYSQDQEHTADTVAINLMMSGGFNPQGAIDFFESLRPMIEGCCQVEKPFQGLASHPSIDERIENARSAIEQRRKWLEYLEHKRNDG